MDEELKNPLGRRRMMRSAMITTAAAAAFSSKITGLHAADAPLDLKILTLALNLEYLEAEFYFRAVYGHGLPSSLTGNSTSMVTGGSAVPWSDSQSQALAQEIADDEYDHVVLLRAAITGAGATPVNEPAIDFTSAFTAAAQAAGLISAGQTFDPFANETNFLLGAFLFEDVGVTAYAGAANLITNKAYLKTAAQILAVEAYHAGEARTRLYLGGYAPQTTAIANARAKLSGTQDDVGVIDSKGLVRIVDSGPDGLVYTRTPGQVLNIVYLGQGTNGGGFFPNGVNGAIHQAS